MTSSVLWGNGRQDAIDNDTEAHHLKMEGSTLWIMVIDPERERDIDRLAKSDLLINVKYKALFVLKEADYFGFSSGYKATARMK